MLDLKLLALPGGACPAIEVRLREKTELPSVLPSFAELSVVLGPRPKNLATRDLTDEGLAF